MAFTWGKFTKNTKDILDMSLEIINLRLHSHHSGANESTDKAAMDDWDFVISEFNTKFTCKVMEWLKKKKKKSVYEVEILKKKN